jgi:hypothetical protein
LLAASFIVLAAVLWHGLRPRTPTVNPSGPGACEEWEKAEVIKQGLGWDLTYKALLSSRGLCPGDPFCEVMVVRPQPQIDRYLAAIQDETIISSLLYELPDGHAGLGATWVVRTKGHAYVWVLHPGQSVTVDKQAIPAADYDRVFEAMACWRQDDPMNRAFGEKGYIGFLSLFKEGKSRQIVLTHNDLFEGNTAPEEGRPGRFLMALKPIRSYW